MRRTDAKRSHNVGEMNFSKNRTIGLETSSDRKSTPQHPRIRTVRGLFYVQNQKPVCRTQDRLLHPLTSRHLFWHFYMACDDTAKKIILILCQSRGPAKCNENHHGERKSIILLNRPAELAQPFSTVAAMFLKLPLLLFGLRPPVILPARHSSKIRLQKPFSSFPTNVIIHDVCPHYFGEFVVEPLNDARSETTVCVIPPG